MTTFNTTRKRDAWATIRGYVYQVDTTIERWLRLEQNQILELERGEDIDLIQQALLSIPVEEQSRLLEQVKHSDKNITLHSTKALEALASFREHQETNPLLDLNFRYVTNAGVAREHQSKLPNQLPGIVAWQLLRENQLPVAERASVLNCIRSLLTNAARPEGFNSNTWKSFTSFMHQAVDAELLGFITRFEWQTDQTTVLEMGSLIKHELVVRHGVQAEAADEIYARLFLRVFKLLSKSGIKRLSREDLKADLARAPLSAADQSLLLRLQNEFNKFEQRILTLEHDVDVLKQQSSELFIQQSELSARLDSSLNMSVIDAQDKLLFRQTLLAHSLYVERAYIENKLNDFLKGSGGYLFFTGKAGYGKTALLANIAVGNPDAYLYYFFSRRDGLTDEQHFQYTLIRQLLIHHGRKGQRLPSAYIQLRALLIELLQTPAPEGRPVRIIIDALDEADFSLKPYFDTLGDGVSIIFSARPLPDRDWLEDLNLHQNPPIDEINLEAFTRDEISRLLHQASINQALSGESFNGLINTLEDITCGDPFFVRLLIDDLLADPDSAYQNITRLATQMRAAFGQEARATSVHPGLRMYMKQWWSEVSHRAGGERAVVDLLGYLTVAHGPLTRDDLISVDPGDCLSGYTVDQSLEAVGRFVSGDEERGYSLCHPRFQEYLRDRIKDRVSHYRQKLINYSMRWREHESAYALKFMIAHLFEAKQYSGLLAAITPEFLKCKVRNFGSYSGALHDLSQGVEAAYLILRDEKALGMALAHCGLQNKVAKMAAQEVIPLFARLGEVNRALEMADLIRDDTRRAITLLTIARETLPHDPELSRKVVRQVLEGWRRYYTEGTCGEILQTALLLFPDEVFSLLEATDEFFLLNALANGVSRRGSVKVEKYGAYTLSLDPSLSDRMSAILKRALSLAEHDFQTNDIRLLLVRLETDPDEAVKYATSDETRVLVAAKHDEQFQSGARLQERTSKELIRVLLEKSSYPAMETLLVDIAAPHLQEIRSFINEINRVEEKNRLLFRLGMAVVSSSDNYKEARRLFFDILRSERSNHRSSSLSSYPLFEEYLKRIIRSTVRLSIHGALRLLNLGPVKEAIHDEMRDYFVAEAIAALAVQQPDMASAEASARLRSPRSVAYVAAEMARVDLDKAVSLWEGLDLDEEEKQKWLARILISARPSDKVKHILDSDLRIEGGRHLYKVPAIVDCAAKIAKSQPEVAKDIANSSLEVARQWLDKEGLNSIQQDLFIAALAPSAARSDLLDAQLLLNYMRNEYGLQAIAATDMLRVLSEERDMRRLLSGSAFWRNRAYLTSLEEESPDVETLKRARMLSLRACDNPDHLITTSGSIFEVSKLRRIIGDARLIGLYMQHGTRGQPKWDSDYVNALRATKMADVRRRLALDFAVKIQDETLREITLAELCGKLSSSSSSHLIGAISINAVRAIALTRIAAHKGMFGQKKRRYLDQAFNEAFIALSGFASTPNTSPASVHVGEDHPTGDQPADERLHEDIYASINQVIKSRLTIELLIEFLREARPLDAERADVFSRAFIKSVLGSKSVRWGYCLLRLSAYGYHLDAPDLTRLNDIAFYESSEREGNEFSFLTYNYYAEMATDVAACVLPANREFGLSIIERAVHYASQVTERAARWHLHISIVDALLSEHNLPTWRAAVSHVMQFDDVIFQTFDRYAQSLLELKPEDGELPHRLLSEIKHAERLMQA